MIRLFLGKRAVMNNMADHPLRRVIHFVIYVNAAAHSWMRPRDVELNGPSAILAVIYCCNVTLGCEQCVLVDESFPSKRDERRVNARFDAMAFNGIIGWDIAAKPPLPPRRYMAFCGEVARHIHPPSKV